MNIPKVLQNLPLNEYDAAFGKATLRVWVNPNLGLVTERGQMIQQSVRVLVAEKKKNESQDENQQEEPQADVTDLNRRMFCWLSAILSQDADADTHQSVQEIAAAHDAAPDFVMWLVARVTRMMDEYRERDKKKPTPRSIAASPSAATGSGS